MTYRSLKNIRKALVTGASSGLGKEYSLFLASKGISTVLVSRRMDKLNELSALIKQQYAVDTNILIADLSSENGINTVEDYIHSNSIQLLINNAGFSFPEDFALSSIEKHIKMMALHNKAAVILTHAVLKNMLKEKTGYIINVSSLAAFSTVPANVTYNASKSFLNSFSMNLAHELKTGGIKVQALCPGLTYTGFHDTEDYKDWDRSSAPEFMWMTAPDVVRISIKALDRKKVVVIPGIMNNLQAFVIRFRLLHLFLLAIFRLLFKYGQSPKDT